MQTSFAPPRPLQGNADARLVRLRRRWGAPTHERYLQRTFQKDQPKQISTPHEIGPVGVRATLTRELRTGSDDGPKGMKDSKPWKLGRRLNSRWRPN